MHVVAGCSLTTLKTSAQPTPVWYWGKNSFTVIRENLAYLTLVFYYIETWKIEPFLISIF